MKCADDVTECSIVVMFTSMKHNLNVRYTLQFALWLLRCTWSFKPNYAINVGINLLWVWRMWMDLQHLIWWHVSWMLESMVTPENDQVHYLYKKVCGCCFSEYLMASGKWEQKWPFCSCSVGFIFLLSSVAMCCARFLLLLAYF